ncbi:aspartate/glutamate racemase family protein [Caldanaerobacter subterraneus]|uniref:Amino acid racemase n=1 Tax=Caldanaerobacter subterraneus TaxID=911092 RepID=A0A7Y2L5J3_9THEO|nr:amino acid racemase [Caldanaerobacter subterraneus]NNG66005.1 amino acid racemase [Caldanaerobacter subterraneus]
MGKKRKIVGILGGLGPMATVDLFRRIVEFTPAKVDQEHLRIIIDCNPQIPDRTKAILYGGPDPTPELIATAKNLVKAGADFIVIPCNTAHYFLDYLKREVDVPIINMIEETARYVRNNYPYAECVGLLATSGTIKSNLYHKAFKKFGISVLAGDEKKTMEAIYGEEGIKAGNLGEKPRRLLKEAAQELIRRGAQVIIAGCTEISLVLGEEDVSLPLVDPLTILAKVAVELALGI